MSNTATPGQDLKTLDQQLNQQVLAGDILGAFEKFYAEDVVMQENTDAPRVGKDANREAEKQFLASVQEFHGAQVLGAAVEGDRSYSEWEMDITFKGGQRVKMTQVAARQWRNGQIVHERFYYNKG